MKSKYLTLKLFKIISILFLCPLVIYAQDVEELFKEGTSQIKIGNYANAINKLEGCIKIDSEHIKTDKLAFAEVHLYRANIYLLQNNPKKAFEEALEAFRVDPRYIGAISILGQFYYLKGDYDTALKYYKRV